MMYLHEVIALGLHSGSLLQVGYTTNTPFKATH